ncbi:MAG TPA: preprotein translocase subunit SecG [Phycisphaerae bacterium]|nr:preprotein translocase subunit SecG [Phycisphaerae bacterium]
MITTLFILLILVSVFLVMVILVQRGRGGGLSGAFGSGGGSSSAFGTKTGDVFTTLTVVTFVVFVILAIILSFQFKYISPPAPPVDVKALDITTTGFNVTWTDSADNETAYKIEQYNEKESTSTAPKWITVKELPASPDTGNAMKASIDHLHLDAGTTYKFHVLVRNGAGDTERLFDVPVPGTKPATATSTPAETSTSSPAATKTAGTSAATTTAAAPASVPASSASAPASAASAPAATRP